MMFPLRPIPAAVSAFATIAFAAPTAAQAAQAAGPVFPVIISAPATLEATPSSGPLFVQPVRSAAAVRVTADTPIAYQARVLDRKMLGAGGGLTLRAGAIFVQAAFTDGAAHCAAVAPKKENLLTFFDVGLCLRDRDADGVFDEQLVFEPTQRIRTAYEITPQAALGGPPVWGPAKVPYAPIGTEEIPAGELRISYEATRFNVRGQGALRLELCWPEALVVPGAVKAGKPLCGILAPPGATVAREGDDVRFHARGQSDQTLSWGQIAVQLTDDGGPPRVRYVAPWPTGPGLVGLEGAFRMANDYKYQQSIFGIAVTPAP